MERTPFIPQIRKIEAKQSLLIRQIRKTEAERTLFFPQIGKIEVKQSLFIPQIRKTVYSTNSKDQSGTNLAYSKNRQDQSEKNELDRSKTNRGGFLKLLWSLGIDSKELNPPAYARADLYNNPIPAQFLAPLDCSKVPALCWYF